MEKQKEIIDFYKYNIDPDHELLEWEKWVTIRKCETNRLGLYLERSPADLAMNLLEKKREDIERKTALEYGQKDKKPKIRGGTWEQPERLHQSCYCKPVYEVHRTPAEMGDPPIIEHVGVPAYVQVEEKGLSGVPDRVECKHLDADYKKYRNRRENQLKNNIKNIDPFRPDVRELIIKGEKVSRPVATSRPIIPYINIDSGTEPVALFHSIYAIRINNTVIYKDITGQDMSHIIRMKQESWHEECTSWNYYFNVPIKKAGRSQIFLQNLGTTTLRYCWKKDKTPITFIPDDTENQVFFFNKNEDVLSPGQSKYINFTFISDKPGIYKESWEIIFCNICFFDTVMEKVIFNLHADATENIDKILKKTEILKARIDRKANYYAIRQLLEDILKKSMTVEPQIYPYKKYFLEAEIFLMKNPVCYYHQTEVMKMKELYREMVPGEEWDLSIPTWRQVMIHKNFEDRMKYYEFLKNSHTDLLKPWVEGEKLRQQKYRAVKFFIGQLADKLDAEYDRIVEMYLPPPSNLAARSSPVNLHIHTSNPFVHNIFSIRAIEHMAATIEVIAGAISSLDLNRWLDFDFCRW